MRRGGGYISDDMVAVKWLLIANVGIFILQQVFRVWFGTPLVERFFALSSHHIGSGYVWAFITYGFLHADFIHILVNMLVIFFVGRILEPYMGTKKFLKLYFVSVFVGGVLWLLLNGSPMTILVGASAAGFGLMTFFCLSYPDRMMTVLIFFVIPVTLKPKWILWGMLAIEGFLFIFYELPGRSVVASSAHLGGILAGFIMFQFMAQRSLFDGLKSIKIETPKWMKKKAADGSKPKFKINIKGKSDLKQEMNRILDKINEKGFGALTAEEKKILDQAKDVLNK